MRQIGVETQLPIGKRAVIRNVWWTSRVFTKKYEGKFVTDLQSKADVEQWYSGISGLPQSQQGSGPSPEWAIRDAIKRNEEHIKLLQAACAELNVALQNCLQGDT